MENTYELEVFTYLTQPENYRAAKQIANQLGAVDDKLRTDFWQGIKKNVADNLELVEKDGWVVSLDYAGQWFSVHRKDWKHLGVNLDQLQGRPDFGIHCSRDVYERVTVDELITTLKQNERMSRSSAAWPCFRAMDFDFRQQSTLENLLPERRDSTIELLIPNFQQFNL